MRRADAHVSPPHQVSNPPTSPALLAQAVAVADSDTRNSPPRPESLNWGSYCTSHRCSYYLLLQPMRLSCLRLRRVEGRSRAWLI